MHTEAKSVVTKFTTGAKICNDYLESLYDDDVAVFETGLDAIDSALGGLERGEMCVVAGRPSHGKSLFGLQWCVNVCEQEHSALFISLEMSEQAIAKRLVANATPVHHYRWRDKIIDISQTVNAFWESKSTLYVTTTPSTTSEIEAAIEFAVKEMQVSFVVIDYLQIIRGSGDDRERIASASRAMKRCGRDNKIALVCLAQLKREYDRDALPSMAHLQHSSQIEQDADQIIFVDWPLQMDPRHTPVDEYRAFGMKNRNRGMSQRVYDLRIDPKRQRINDVPVEDSPNFSREFAEWNE